MKRWVWLLFLAAPAYGVWTFNICGWETGDSTEAFFTNGTWSVQNTTKRTGGYALKVNPTGTAAGRNSFRSYNASGSSTYDTYNAAWGRFYFRYATKATNFAEMIYGAYTSGAALKLGLLLNSDGNLVVRNAASVDISTGTTVLNSGTWYRIEVYVSTGATTGPYEVRIDGVSELSGTSNISATANAAWAVGKITNIAGNTVEYYYDDIAFSSNTWIGAGEVLDMLPDSAGTYSTWTRGGSDTGNDYSQVNEVPINTSSYLISTLTTGNATTLNLESAATAGISGTINAVKSLFTTVRDGAADSTTQIRLRENGADKDAANATISSTVLTLYYIFPVVPSSLASWTTTDLDAAEVGMVEAETTDKTRFHSGRIMVDYTPSVASAAPPVRRVLVAE